MDKALGAITDCKLEPVSDEIYKSHEDTDYIKMDETTYLMNMARPYVWCCVSDNAVTILPATSRGRIVLEMYFSHLSDRPITVDGYAVYNLFGTIQRCRAHILREAKFEANDPLTRLLCERLQDLFWEARHLRLGAPVDFLVARTLAVAEVYKSLDIHFGTTLENAAENLYTFVRYPGMDPTNNESERMLRKVVIHRKIRQKFVTVEGMRRFGVRLSCMLTSLSRQWRMR